MSHLALTVPLAIALAVGGNAVAAGTAHAAHHTSSVTPALFGPPAEPGTHWAEGTLVARVLAAPDVRARKVAQARIGARHTARAALSQALEAKALALPLTSNETVGQFLAKEGASSAKARLEKLTAAPEIVGRRWFSDGGLELWGAVSLEAIAKALHPAPKVEHQKGKRAGTWLVDARELSYPPALWIRLVDPEGAPIGPAEGWAARRASDPKAAKKGVHGRVRTLVASATRDGALVVAVPKETHPPREVILLTAAASEGPEASMARVDPGPEKLEHTK